MTQQLLQDLAERGLIYQTSDRDELASHLESGSRTLYCGFDPTADSLHLGHLLPLLVLRRFQLAGHRPIAVIGGATGLIGDPSGKDQERRLNKPELTEEWGEQIKGQVSRYLDFSSSSASSALIVNNLDWTKQISLIDFLRDTGKYFSVNAMVQKESVRGRISREESGISFTEFSYMLLQSLDYSELVKKYDCSLQIGGSDQWGNITSGMDLVRKSLQKRVHALTMPLITKADGTKFGKSDGNQTVWLKPEYTSPYQFYQFWINTSDDDMMNMLGYFTLMESGIRKELIAEHRHNPEKRLAQHRLAKEMTELVHGKEALESAKRITTALFDSQLDRLNIEDFSQLEQDGLPCLRLTDINMPLRTAFTQIGLVKNTNAFKDAMNSGAITINGEIAERFNANFADFRALYDRWFLLRFGKRKWGMAVISEASSAGSRLG